MNRALISAFLCSMVALAQEGAPKEAPMPAERPAPAKAAHPIPVGKPYIACKETKLYHRGRCKAVEAIKKGTTGVEFTWKAEAEQAGYKPCGDCMTHQTKAKAKPKAH